MQFPNEWETLEYHEIHSNLKCLYLHHHRLGLVLLYNQVDNKEPTHVVNIGHWYYGNHYCKINSNWLTIFWICCTIFIENDRIEMRYVASHGYEYYYKDKEQWEE